MTDKAIDKDLKKDIFEADSSNGRVVVKIDENNKIKYISYCFKACDDYSWHDIIYRQDSSSFKRNITNVFESMLFMNISILKSLLEAIKETEPQYYKEGTQLLERTKK